MEDDECACDSDPEAFTSATFCDTKASDFKEEHDGDSWEEQNGAACGHGCKACCDANFLQLGSAQKASRAAQCKECAAKLHLHKK